MKNLLPATLIAATLASSVLAQQKTDDHAAHHPPAAAASSTDMTEGEVRKIDKDAKKITIKHGEIKSLEMPPMIMVFQVKDASLLDKVKAGDMVRFGVEKTATGAFMLTAIQPAK